MQKIVLNEISIQNFLSIGDSGLTMKLDDVKSTLIIGDNGAGKTTILEAVTFALYNRTYRKLKQEQIVNSVVQKDCMVKLRFTVGNEEYIVVRVLKGSGGVGNTMTMYTKDDSGEFTQMEDLVGSGNQERLERIFGIKFNVYKQLIVLGTSGYEEFMRLSTTERRKLIENILGLDLIGHMDEENKGLVKNLNLMIDQINIKIQGLENEIERSEVMVQRIKDSEDSNKERLNHSLERLDSLKFDILDVDRAIETTNEYISKLPVVNPPDEIPLETIPREQLDMFSEASRKIASAKSTIDSSMREIDKKLTSIGRDVTIFNSVLDRYKSGGKCPSCNQQLSEHDEEPKNIMGIISEKNEEIAQLNKDMEGLKEKMKSLNDKAELFDKKRVTLQEELDQKNFEINKLNISARETYRQEGNERIEFESKLRSLQKEKSTLESQILDVERDIVNIKKVIENDKSNQVASLDDIKKKLSDLQEEKAVHLMEVYQRSIITNILKDSGVKSDIIDRYIPLFNKLVQGYLDILGADYLFVVDSNFKESILSRGREKFTYESFSRGEQARIDLAILFAWRDIISKVSGFDMSVLFLDEVFDSSTDKQGVDYLKRLLNTSQDDQIIYSISHKEHNPDDFDSIIRVSKRGRFSHYDRSYREG